MPVLGLPLLLLGLAALPVAAGIYWLRTRYREQPVSALFLWQSAAEAQGGGRKKNRLQTPLSLLLELLVLGLLVLAATAPRILRPDNRAAVTVILDDSYSMTAQGPGGAGDSPRTRGIAVLREELSRLGRYRVRVIRAGPEPELMEGSTDRWADLQNLLEGWRPEAATADLNAAIELAAETGSPQTRVLVLTDRPPRVDDEDEAAATDDAAVAEAAAADEAGSEGEAAAVAGRVRWHAVGRPADNVGLVNAVRTVRAGEGGAGGGIADESSAVDRVLLEVANFSDRRQSRGLELFAAELPTVGPGTDGLTEWRRIDRRELQLEPGETRRIWWSPAGLQRQVVLAELDGDALSADDSVTLLPEESAPLPVSVAIDDPQLDRDLRRALRASGRVVLVSEGSRLHFTDRVEVRDGGASASATDAGADEEREDANQRRWTLRFITAAVSAEGDRGSAGEPTGQAVQSFLGPFVMDLSHPMTEGVSLAGLVWSAPGPSSTDGGGSAGVEGAVRPLVTVGSRVLLEDAAGADGSHRLRWTLEPDTSTLLQSAAFPVMVWNLIDWRAGERPGVRPVNAPPGTPVTVMVDRPVAAVAVRRIAGGKAEPGAAAQRSATAQALPVDQRRAVFAEARPGVYTVQIEDANRWFSVQRASAEESDLRRTETRSVGEWDRPETVAREYRGLAWALGLGALGLLLLHAWWVYGPSTAGGDDATRLAAGGSA